MKKILFIEDGAHSGKIIGELGFLSFGRDKVVSGAYLCGGAVVAGDEKLRNKLVSLTTDLARKKYWPFYLWAIYLILQTYKFFWAGKLIHRLFKNFLPKVLTDGEKRGEKPEKFYTAPPGVLAQWDKLENFIKHRQRLAEYYAEQLNLPYNPGSTYLRFNIFVDDPDGLRRFAAKENIFLGDWYDQVVAPKGVDLEKVGYKIGSCPQAELTAKKIVNLPTNPNLTLDDAKKVVKIIKLWKR